MLRFLAIRQVAVIDELEVEFAPGFNVLTGETGAGKSIVTRALTLLCGARPSVDILRSDADEASVEGVFEAIPAESLERLGLPVADEVVVRRVVARNGRARAWVNGAAVAAPQLSALGPALMRVYGQHEHTALLRADSHLEILDDFAHLQALRTELQHLYAQWQAACRQWDRARQQAASRSERLDLLGYQIAELRQAAVGTGEKERLLSEREKLRHVEKLQRWCGESEAALESGDFPVVATVSRVAAALADAARVDPAVHDCAALVEQARTLVQQAAFELRRYLDRLEFDPERLAAIEDRLALIGRLERKYGCDADALPERLAQLEQEAEALESGTLDPRALLEAAREAFARARAVALELSAQRQRAAQELATRMRKELRALGMPQASFHVEFVRRAAEALPETLSGSEDARTVDALGPAGADQVEFYWSANPGETPRPLARIASGGELSRVMLALKVLSAGPNTAGAWLFDEVDAGIGGTTATAVGKRLHLLARHQQVLCITHLPQIAVYADCHLAVDKVVRGGKTYTTAKVVQGEERVRELARMLGKAGAESERYARELLAAVKAG